MKRKITVAVTMMFLLIFLVCPPLLATDTESTETETPTTPTETTTTYSSLSPNIIISGYSFGGDYVTNGQKFTLNYTLKNTSASITVKNIIVKVGSGENLVISKDTDTFFVDSIAPKGTKSLSIALTPMMSATTSSYPVNIGVSFEYFDGDTKYQGSADLNVTVPLQQEQKLRLENVGFSETEIYSGNDYEFCYKIINSGYAKAGNMEAKVYDADGNLLASSYLGSLAASAELNNAGNLYIAFDQAGTETLKFVLSYEDDLGNSQSLSETTELEVLEYVPPVSEEEEIPMEETGGVPIWAWIALLILIAAASTFSILHARKKKAQKKAALEAEEDGEEDDEDF